MVCSWTIEGAGGEAPCCCAKYRHVPGIEQNLEELRMMTSLGRLRQVPLLLVGLLSADCKGYGPCSDLKIGDRVRLEVTGISFKPPCSTFELLDVGSVLELTVTEEIRGDFCITLTGTVTDPSGSIRFDRIAPQPGTEDSEQTEDAFGAFYGQYTTEPAPSACSTWMKLGFASPFYEGDHSPEILEILSDGCGNGTQCGTHFDVIATRL